MNQPQDCRDNAAGGARISIEMALWVLVGVLALGLRLVRLGAAPLDVGEAREAMQAWRAATGQGMPGSAYSPVLFWGNALLFFLCEANDALARLWPVLFGALLCVMPALLRQRIGRGGALAAGSYLAFSPTLLMASRRLDGAIVAAVGGMAVVGGLVRYREARERRWVTLAAAGLALSLAASSATYGLLLVWLLVAASASFLWPDRVESVWRSLRPILRHGTLVCLILALGLCTGLGWNPGGLAAAGDLFPAWLARFQRVTDPAASPLAILVAYESFGLILGTAGLVWSVSRRSRFGVLLGMWAGFGTVLPTLMGGRAVEDTLWAILPLALLGGLAIERLVRAVSGRASWLGEKVYVAALLALWCHCCLRLATYARSRQWQDLALALLGIVSPVLLGSSALLMTALARIGGLLDNVQFAEVRAGIRAELRAVAVTAAQLLVGVVVPLVILSTALGVAYYRVGNPRELLWHKPTADEVRYLVHTLRDLSWPSTGTPTKLPLTLEADADSVLAWYLRDFTHLRRLDDIAGLPPDQLGSTLVTTRRTLPWLDEPTPAYIGQPFPLRRSMPRRAAADGTAPSSWLKLAVEWLFYRRTPTPVTITDWAVLWRIDEPSRVELPSHSH